ncbi:MAG: sodium ion-translocating decarboxylase subunit beta, partial [Arcobacter sp.]|nr:sodium ion-translocating decarboxylase subunit beta [Arcobacter sp.]
MKKNILIAFFLIFSAFALNSFASTPAVETQEKQPYHSKTMSELVDSFYATTGIKALFEPKVGVLDSHGKDMTLFAQGAGRIIMIFICF